MNNVIFLWINNYRLIDEIDGKRHFLFNDFGVNLSSKFNISHEWILQDKSHEEYKSCEDKRLLERRLCIKLNENKSKVLFIQNVLQI